MTLFSEVVKKMEEEDPTVDTSDIYDLLLKAIAKKKQTKQNKTKKTTHSCVWLIKRNHDFK